MKLSRHYLILVGIILLGAILRFWHLTLKPVWLDEVITALFSLGRNYDDVPLNEAFSLSALEQVFTLNPDTSCAQIAHTVASQSVHPPLFFCWMHDWLRWSEGLPFSWIWKLRALPAFVGVVAIAALYQLNRIAFSPAAGLAGAMVMAVSPFAVYLSQEARHYTLPMLLVILSLLGLYQVQTDLYQRKIRPGVWCGWIVVNSLGFYVHYFFLLAFAAQVATLLINILTFKSLPTLHPAPYTLHTRRALIAVTLAASGVCFTYLPWLPTFLSHMSRPETNWMKPFEPDWMDAIAPLYQFPAGWLVMVIALPIENQPLGGAILMGVLMLLFTLWLLWQLAGRFGQLWSTPDTHLATRMLVVFVLCVLLEFVSIVYVLGKDITSVPRYNFLYFPALCALLGACLAQPQVKTVNPQRERYSSRHLPPTALNLLRFPGRSLVLAVLLIGCLSSTLVVSNQVFLKPYQPDLFARNLQRGTDKTPLLLGMPYRDLQDVALGLSFALALHDPNGYRAETNAHRYMVFMPRFRLTPSATSGNSDRLRKPLTYDQIWQNLTTFQPPLMTPFDFWMVAPGLKRTDYPSQLFLRDAAKTAIDCTLDPSRYYRLGVPYQLYRCEQ